MLLSNRCPHTGVVNFYDASEPHLSIGSITKCGTSAAGDAYAWRYYGTDKTRSGVASDASVAERKLKAILSQLVASNDLKREPRIFC